MIETEATSKPPLPTGALHSVWKGFLIGFATLCFLCFGVLVSGKSVAARNLYRSLAATSFPVDPIPGSKVGYMEEQAGLAGTQWSISCEVNASVESVIDHYLAVAKRDAVQSPNGESFHVHANAPGMQSVVWINDDDQRLGVVAMAKLDGQSTRYHLFQSEGYAKADPTPVTHLPLGLQAPSGSKAYFDFRGSDHSYGYFISPREPGDVYRELAQSAQTAGVSPVKKTDVLDSFERDSGFRSLTVTNGSRNATYSIRKLGVGRTQVIYHTSTQSLR